MAFACKALLCATLFLQSNLAVSQEANVIKRWLYEGISANSDNWSSELKKLSVSEVKKEAIEHFYKAVFSNDWVMSALASLLERHGYETKILQLISNPGSTSASSSTAEEVKNTILKLLSRMGTLGRVRINEELQRSAIEFHLALLNTMPRDVCGRHSSTGLNPLEHLHYSLSVDDNIFVRAYQAHLAAIVAEAEGIPKAKIPLDAEFKAVAPLFVRNVESKARSRDNYTQLKPYLDNLNLDNQKNAPPEIFCEISKLYLEVVLDGFGRHQGSSVMYWTALEVVGYKVKNPVLSLE